MSETRHTPAPWEFGGVTSMGSGRGYYYVVAADGTHVCDMRDRPTGDAHLIAAAPDLLAVVQEVVARCEGHGAMTDAALRRARAALAKATGGEPTPTADATQAPLFDLPAPKAPSAIAEGR